MGCCQHYEPFEGGDGAFTVDPPLLTFGSGCAREAGDLALALGMRRVALMTDATVVELEPFAELERSLREAGLDVVVYDEVHVEPTSDSFEAAIAFARDGRFDGYVSAGGGSVIDTTKAANLYATWPAELLAYVNAPIGEGRAVPGPLRPHLACPTTSGTGSEATGIAVFDLLSMAVKTGISAPALRPSRALVDPAFTASLPRMVLACGAFDILCHALESFTARPYTRRPPPPRPHLRPASQGANPWSDMGCREALRLLGRFMVRAIDDPTDVEARTELMWASSLAGIAFGNAGVHAPHGMAYAVAGLVRDFVVEHYPPHPMVPHGMSVVLGAPAVFRLTAGTSPARHLEAAELLGADVRGAGPDAEEAGEVLAERLVALMRACGMPSGLREMGYDAADVEALTRGAHAQQRLLTNAPCAMTPEVLSGLFARAMRYW
ncbi:MAG: iron-containing alcohol dehydrogenase [Myxococcales bacterium]|nr:iron-containing alcohol dehydrogenase [Myxococcales bacterium]